MEEVRPSYLVLMLTCPASLAKGYGGSPNPYPHSPQGISPASPGTMDCLNLPTASALEGGRGTASVAAAMA